MVACLAAAVAAASAADASARRAWQVTGYSLRYEQTSQASHPVCDPQFSYPTGYDESTETVSVTLSGLQARTIKSPWRRPPVGPVTRPDPFGGRSTLGRSVSKQLVNCLDGSQQQSACNDTRPVTFGSQESFTTGSFRLTTNRGRKLVRVRVTGFGFEPEILECQSDPESGFFLGPPAPLNKPILLRGTVPLSAFAHRTTTIRLTRELGPPSDARSRGIPLGTAKISVKIVLKRTSTK